MSVLFSLVLAGLGVAMRWCAWRHPAYRAELAARD